LSSESAARTRLALANRVAYAP